MLCLKQTAGCRCRFCDDCFCGDQSEHTARRPCRYVLGKLRIAIMTGTAMATCSLLRCSRFWNLSAFMQKEIRLLWKEEFYENFIPLPVWFCKSGWIWKQQSPLPRNSHRRIDDFLRSDFEFSYLQRDTNPLWYSNLAKTSTEYPESLVHGVAV